MHYMLSLSVNIPGIPLADVSQVLAELAQHGQIEDISLRLIPERAAVVTEDVKQVGNGAQVLEFPGAAVDTKRRRKPASNTAAGVMPAAQPEVADNTGSDEAVTSYAQAVGAQAAVVAVGQNEGTTSLPAADAAVVVPSSNVPAIEDIRIFCANAVQTDGTRRITLTKALAELGCTSISALPEDKRADFFTRMQEEFK